MILVDTSVWIDHLRDDDAALSGLLNAAQVLGHPFVIGEIALGQPRHLTEVVSALRQLPVAECADANEVLQFIESHSLGGTGIGYVDAHLLASVMLTPGSQLWTRDKRLLAVADQLGLSSGLS